MAEALVQLPLSEQYAEFVQPCWRASPGDAIGNGCSPNWPMMNMLPFLWRPSYGLVSRGSAASSRPLRLGANAPIK